MTARGVQTKVLRRPAPTTLVPPLDAPRSFQRTTIDFRTLDLPVDVAKVFSDAFWHRLGAGPVQTILDHWARLKFFGRFNSETGAVQGLADLKGDILVRYLEWLNAQRTARGTPFGKATSSSTYTAVLKLLQWLARCRPELIRPIDWPVNPFPWRNRDTSGWRTISAALLKDILKACEHDIAEIRLMRARGRELREAARAQSASYMTAPGAVLDYIDQEFDGVLPPTPLLFRTHNHFLRYFTAHGGVEFLEPYLYPSGRGLLPYYLAMVLHTAGNSQAIAEMSADCLRAMPLLEDRELLVWDKARAGSLQRRSFRSSDPFGPPALVRDIIEWTRPLRMRVPPHHRKRLFLIKTSTGGPSAATRIKFSGPLRWFIETHRLAPFSMVHSLLRVLLGSLSLERRPTRRQVDGEPRQHFYDWQVRSRPGGQRAKHLARRRYSECLAGSHRTDRRRSGNPNTPGNSIHAAGDGGLDVRLFLQGSSRRHCTRHPPG